MGIILSTGDINRNYEILSTVFAIDSHQGGFFKAINPAAAFTGVNEQLKTACKGLGGDAVICCLFEYRNALADGLMGKKQAIEIFAYGTAVKFID